MTVEFLKKCVPGVTAVNAAFIAPHLKNAMEHYKITTSAAQAAFLAQLAHESASLNVMSENLNYTAAQLRKLFSKYFPTDALAAEYARKPEKIANRIYANRMGNGDEASGDGWKHRGAGFIQTTGAENQLAAAREFGKTPEEISNWLRTHAGAAWSAAFFWHKNGLNAIADKPASWRGNRGKHLNLDPFTYISVVINGGLIGIEDRRKHYEISKKALGIK